MFEHFFHQIDKEIGPLNPDWFEELTAKASRDEGCPGSLKDEREEDTAKAPETSALASQLFSTPKIFKQQHFQSPDSIPKEESPYEVTNGDSSAFPWTESSPCLFGSAKDCHRFGRSCEKPKECFGGITGLLDTPKRSLARSAKRISESLGAQINPDLSWTSSYNTPSSLTPTVILPKTEDCGTSSSGLKDKEAIFVRKLFPSLSKVSTNIADDTTLKQDVIANSETIHADDLGENPVCSPKTSLDTSGLWKQKVPSAIEDGDVRTTVQNVLDGAEDVLSIFFSNNASTLRRIKTKDRIRRKIISSPKDVKSLVLTSEPDEIVKADVETKSPSKNKDIIQWTPLSLSESILNGGCSGVSLINNCNTVASRETNGGTVFNYTAENNQTFSQTLRLGSYQEEAQRQTLFDKSPAFMLTGKPRKFVYQVPSSEFSKTVNGHKAAVPVCLDQTVKERSSVEKMSSDLNESRYTSEYAINNQTLPQSVEPLSTEPCDFDHRLDITQLSKAFAEDFTQEIKPRGLLDVPVKNDQNGKVQPNAELEEHKLGNLNGISNLADISVNSPNKSTAMLTTFDISHDSGCPTTFSDLEGTRASCGDIKEFYPTFKTANNNTISIPSEAIMRAKASLDEAAEDCLSITSKQTTPKHYQTVETLYKTVSGSTKATRSPVGQFIFPNHASIMCVSDAPKSDSPKRFNMNISSYSSPQSNESDYKTGSKKNVTASDVGLQTETLLKEKLGRDSSKCIHQKPDFKKSAERRTVFDINSTHKPTALDSSRDDIEKNGSLTASQKADVTELCNLLEEANSQHEFTQFKPINLGSDSNTTERDWDADIVNDMDFDDSFNCDFVKGKDPVKTDVSSVNSSDHFQTVVAAKLSPLSKETQSGIIPLSVIEENSLVDGMKNALSNFSDNAQFPFHGFKTAEGKPISISEKSLNKARHLFEEDVKEVKVDIGVIKSELSASTSDSINTESKTHNVKDIHFSYLYGNTACKEINKQVAGMEQNCLDEKTKAVPWGKTSIKINQPDSVVVNQISDGPDIPSFNSENVFQELESCSNAKEVCAKIVPSKTFVLQSGQDYGFQTASGKRVCFSTSALKKAKDLFKDCDSNIDCQESANVEGKNDKLVETIEQTNASTSNCKIVTFSDVVEAKTVFKDTDLMNDFSMHSSLHQKPPQEKVFEQKGLQNEFSKYLSELLPVNSDSGFSTASGKKVCISAEALQRAKDAFSESVDSLSCANGSQKTKQLVDNQTDTNSSGEHKGFSTAGGKKVAVSATALQRAKSLFNDSEEESLASGSLRHQGCKGFSTASGKDVSVSENASVVTVAFAGCDESSFSHEPKNYSGNNVGFSTAGGKKVAFSATALQRAKSLFKGCEEENIASKELVPEKVPPETKSSHRKSEDILDGNLKFEQLNKKNCGFSTANGKCVSVSKVALEEASKLFRDCDAQVTATDKQLLQSDFSKGCTQHKGERTETTLHPLPAKVIPNVHAQLDLHSLDFTSCTDTQQKYFEQEAMACTEALLADEDLNESAKLVSSEGTDYKKSPSIHDLQTLVSFDQNRRRKRQFDSSCVADSGQPPLKRQLLSEFDQTLNARSSGLTPLKSCPNVTLKDRRVFRYNVHLKPNVTAPEWHHVGEKSNDHEQHCSTVSVQNRRNSDTKGVFVPPFQKVLMAGTSNSQNVSKASSGFIPAFKKEDKVKTDHSNQMDKKMTTSTSHSDSCVQYCNEKNLQEGYKPQSTTSVERVVKIIDSEEKDTEAWQETLNLARDMQDMRLRKKKRQTIRPLPGSLYLAKTSGVPRICLRDAVGSKCPGQYTQEELYKHGVHQKVSKITSENAESFRFDCNDFFKRELLIESGALQLADGGWLVPDSKGTAGKDEFYSALCDTPGVDPKLISDAWVFNHYRWIVWKRASMERTFPVLMGNLCLTPEQVLLQLKFRYDVEVDHSQRSALRRIMERDDTPAKTLVLCVCGVVKTCQNPEKPVKGEKTPNAKMESCVIWLTDGWYSIKGLLDPPLSAMLNKGRLRIGDKIVTSGAELVGSQEACSPLEAPDSLMLKISANSTRRARWDTKLGYYRDPRPIKLPLSSLCTAGGLVSCVNIVVLRSYPTQLTDFVIKQWMEKKPNGVFIFRNDRAEDRESRKHSNSKHKSMDLLISKIQTQFEKEMEGKTKSRCQRRTFSRHEVEALQDGEELNEAMERDPAIETHLSERQMEVVSKYRRCLGERSQAELQERVQKAVMEAQEAEGGCPNRDVTPVWKLSITDANDLQNDFVYTLNIWRPSQDLYGLLREGHKYRVYHLATSEGKKRSGIAHVQLTATKKTLFRDVEVSPEWLHQHFRPRARVRFRELQNPQFSSPCGEVDIVGYIVSIVGKQGNCPVLHLVDENFDLVSVRTYSSLEQLAVEDLVKPQALIALSNVQVRPPSGPVPSLYAGEQALFSVNPKESHLQEAMAHLKTFVQTCEQFFSIAEEKVSDVVPSGVLSCFQSPRTPAVQSNQKINGRVTPQQKSSSFSPFTPLNIRTPVSANNSEGKDPKNLKRRRGLDYLSRIPSPPPLTPLKTRASPCVNKTFNPPRRSVTPKPPQNESPRALRPPPGEETWVHDEELVMIDTQALLDGLREG